MGLNYVKKGSKMYNFIDATWNPIKGICPHKCSYCYMKRWWPEMKKPRPYEKELKVNPGEDNFIFIGSSIDMWAESIPDTWIANILYYLYNFKNKYLFQSKNPYAFKNYIFPENTILCTTIETNRPYKKIMGNCPMPIDRYHHFCDLQYDKKMVTIEPIMDFDIDIMIRWIKDIRPEQINIGADSGGNNLPEPSKAKTMEFIYKLNELGFNYYLKPNLKRIIGE